MLRPLAILAVVPIRLYRLTLSAFVGRSCRHLPSCSEYAEEAILRHGPWRGGWLALARIARCRPGGSDGYDPVPALEGEHHPWWAPWRYGRWSGDHITTRLAQDRGRAPPAR